MGRHRREQAHPAAAPPSSDSSGCGTTCAVVAALILAAFSFGAGFHAGREWEKVEVARPAAPTSPRPTSAPPVAPTVRVEASDPTLALELIPYPPLTKVQRSGSPPPGVEERRASLRPLFHATDVEALVRDGTGRIWAGTTDALATIDAGPPLVVTRASVSCFVPNFRRLAVDPTGAVCFIGGVGGELLVRRSPDGTLRTVPMAVPGNTASDCLLAGVPDGVLAIDARLSRGVVWLPYLDGEWRAPRVVTQAQPWEEVCSLVPDGRGLLLKTPKRVFRVEGEKARPFVSLEEDPATPASPPARLLQSLAGHRSGVDMSAEAAALGGWTGPDMELLAPRAYSPYRLAVWAGAPVIPVFSEKDELVVGSSRLSIPQGPWDDGHLDVNVTLSDAPDCLWIGTDRGLVRLEGNRLRFVGAVASTYPRPVLRYAAQRECTGLAAGPDGTVILGHSSGAGVLTTTAMIPLISRTEGSPDVAVWPHCPSADLIVGTGTDLSAVRRDPTGAYRLESLLSWAEVGAQVDVTSAAWARLAATDQAGGLWMRTSDNVFHAPPGRPLDTLPPPLGGSGPTPGLLAVAPDGAVWVSESGGRVAEVRAQGRNVEVTRLLDYHSTLDAAFGGDRSIMSCGNYSLVVTSSAAVATGFEGMRCLVASSSGVIWGFRSHYTDDGETRIVRWDGNRVTQVTLDRPRFSWGRFSMAPARDGGLYIMDTGLWHLAAEDLE